MKMKNREDCEGQLFFPEIFRFCRLEQIFKFLAVKIAKIMKNGQNPNRNAQKVDKNVFSEMKMKRRVYLMFSPDTFHQNFSFLVPFAQF